jgi:branched-chain amino acid aminotransferase
VAFKLDDHLARLRRSLHIMRMPCADLDALPGVVDELVARNDVREDTYLRIAVSIITPGTLGVTDVQTATTATLTRMGRKSWLAERTAMRLRIGPWQRAGEMVFPPAVKCIANYAGARLSTLQARAEGYDDAILLGADGRLAEAPTANLFLVHRGLLRTPQLRDGVLAGITRATLLELAASLGIAAREETLTRGDAYDADEAFLCGTGLELAPIAFFDGLPVALPAPGPVTSRLIDAYFQLARSAQ